MRVAMLMASVVVTGVVVTGVVVTGVVVTLTGVVVTGVVVTVIVTVIVTLTVIPHEEPQVCHTSGTRRTPAAEAGAAHSFLETKQATGKVLLQW